MLDKWPRVRSLASTCWIALLVLGGIGVAINWNLFMVMGGMLAIFGIGLGVIFLPAIIKQWEQKTEQTIDVVAKRASEKFKAS